MESVVSDLVKEAEDVVNTSPAAIELLLQGSSEVNTDGLDVKGICEMSRHLGESDDTGLTDNTLSIAEQPMDISHEATGEEAVSIQEISNLAAVNIINMAHQPMFQLVSDGDESSYMQLSDSCVQTVSGDSALHTVALPSPSSLDHHAIQLDDGTTAIVHHNIQPNNVSECSLDGSGIQLGDGTEPTITRKEPSAARLLEGQMIQLEDGTTGFIQASLSGGDLQSVQLEDGSTAYISLFNDAGGGALSIDSDPPQDVHAPIQVIAGDETSHQGSVTDSDLSSLANIKQEHSLQDTSNSSVLDDQSTSISEHGSLSHTSNSTNQPHVSFRALALGEKAYKCDYENCGRLYTTLHHLKVHGRSHTGDKPFKCEFPSCGKAFATGYGLKSHTRVHTGEKPYRCTDPACNKAFKTSGDLQKHIRTHTGERPFKCPFEGCDRMFTTSNIRKVHIRTHTGERPYVCDEDGCKKSFASATNYKNHIRIHTGEKPYVCTVEGCGKRFTEYSSLYKHHVVHTQSKPYICNHCHKTYRQTSTLAMHKRTIHNDHDPSLEGEGLLGTIQLVNPVAVEGAEPREGDADGALVINTSESALPLVSPAGSGRQTLPTIQAHSSALLQHLQPSGISMQDIHTMQEAGIQQVYLIADPTQIETLKQMATHQQHQSPIQSEDNSTTCHDSVTVVPSTMSSSCVDSLTNVVSSDLTSHGVSEHTLISL